MEIRYWNIEQEHYTDMPAWYYFIDKNGDVFCEGKDGMEEQLHIEPHFYINGERVA